MHIIVEHGVTIVANYILVILSDCVSFLQDAGYFIIQDRVMRANEFKVQSNADRVGNTLKSRVAGHRM